VKSKEVKNLLKEAMAQKGLFSSDDDDDYTRIFPIE
jgi:hypothetical protein